MNKFFNKVRVAITAVLIAIVLFVALLCAIPLFTLLFLASLIDPNNKADVAFISNKLESISVKLGKMKV